MRQILAQHPRADGSRIGTVAGYETLDCCAGVSQKSIQRLVTGKSVFANTACATFVVMRNRKCGALGHGRRKSCRLDMNVEPLLADRNIVAVYE